MKKILLLSATFLTLSGFADETVSVSVNGCSSNEYKEAVDLLEDKSTIRCGGLYELSRSTVVFNERNFHAFDCTLHATATFKCVRMPW